MNKQTIEQIIKAEKLPGDFLGTVQNCYAPIAEEVAQSVNPAHTFVLGVQGCQGSGKSTLSIFLKSLLESQHQLTTAILSIDDFYLTKAQRLDLAQTVHPLLKTRGVPGTHDVQLAIDTINALKHLKPEETFAIPRFDKAADDRASQQAWDSISGPIQVIILEGWCVGLHAQKESDILDPINSLEINEDPTGTWRSFVNKQLQSEYQELFALIEKLVVLAAPSFACVKHWRSLQEQKLAETLAQLSPAEQAGKRIMSEAEVTRFISHYQRLTEHALNTLPVQADWLLALDEAHQVRLTKQLTVVEG
ncbi:Pantothenate kinase [Thalassocella blandensis]|nr:Pantothenate kinase [Thalassocella blandensis]